MRILTDLWDHLKGNRTVLLATGVALLLLFSAILSLWNHVDAKGELESEHARLVAELSNIERAIGEKQAVLDEERSESVREITGVDSKLVQADTSAAREYFAPAFNWKSGHDYDLARHAYIESLGEDNSFTKTYLPPDTKIETNEGALSYIDHEGLMVTMEEIHVVPVTVEDNRMRYLALVSYFMHRNSSDTANKEALEMSEAIVEFTVVQDEESNSRFVTEVKARPGFQSAVSER